MWNLQAIELLAICLAVGIFGALLLIIGNCATTCYEHCRKARRKSADVERLPDDYVNEIHRLLDRHKKVMNEYDYPDSEHDLLTPETDNFSPVTESLLGSPVKMRSRSNSGKLQKLKTELDEFRIDSPELVVDRGDCEEKRRTWGGLTNSVFEPIDLPNSFDAQVQTTDTLERMTERTPLKIETTV